MSAILSYPRIIAHAFPLKAKETGWAGWFMPGHRRKQEEGRVISSAVFLMAMGSTGWTLLTSAHPYLLAFSVLLLGSALVRAEYLRRRAERRRVQREHDFVATFEQAAVGLAHVSTTGHFLKTNERLSVILGYSKEEFRQLTFAQITYPEDLDRDMHYFSKVLEGEISRYATEKRYYRKDGSVIWTNLTVALLREPDGRPKYFISVIEDISERKRAQEELKAASEAKDRFISIISHELRTPLTPVLAALSAEGVERVDLNDPTIVAMMRRNIEHETSIINDLLDLTRISTSGKLKLELQPVDLHQLIREAYRSLDRSLREHRLQCQLYLDAPRAVVSGDPLRLRQILLNLLENAIKFTPPGGLITIRTKALGPINGCTEGIDVEVSDTGIGIPDHEAERIFAPFEQCELPNGSSRGGLGLGLAIVKGLVEAHGGNIRKRPSPQGSCFGFNLCLSHEEVRVEDRETVEHLRHLQILLVEDHEDTRSTLQRLLSRRGHRVTPVTSVPEAIDAFTRHPYNLVISDIGLPGESGLDLPHALARRREGVAVPCIALSGFGSGEDIQRSYQAGFSRHLTKPVGMHDLDLAIQDVTSPEPNGGR